MNSRWPTNLVPFILFTLSVLLLGAAAWQPSSAAAVLAQGMDENEGAAGDGGETGENARENLIVTSELLLITYDEVGAVDVLNLVTIANAGDVPRQGVTLPLASGAVVQQIQASPSQGTFNQGQGEQLVHEAILQPGDEVDYRLEYRLLAPTLPLTLTRPILYPTERMTVMTEAGRLELWSEGFAAEGVEQLAEQDLQIYRALEMEPADEWRLGLVEPGAAGGPADVPVYLPREGLTGFFWAAWGAILAVAAVTLWARPYRPAPPRSGEADHD